MSVANVIALAHTEVMENVKIATKSGFVVECSKRADERIVDVETFSDDDCGNVVIVTLNNEDTAKEMASYYRAWGVEVIEVEHECLVLAA